MVMGARADEDNDPKPFPTNEIGRRALNAAVRPGLTFREVMTGMITKGSTDPAEGYENDAAVAMSLRVVVDIANLPAFLRDPNHRGRWAASGDIPVWGGPIISGADGDFRLFRRTIDQDGKDSTAVREMVYETFITVGGQTYHLRGRKVIQPAPLWRAWAATTTMYVRFFEVGNTSGPPVAAGVLRLSIGGFLRQLTTMKVTDGLAVTDQLYFLSRFYRFFVGSLIRTYVLRRRW